MSRPTYCIGTLVTRPDMYNEMCASFVAHGFTDGVDWIKIDNTGVSQTDAFSGLNSILNRTSADYVILCHQDIVLLEHDRDVLDARLADLNRHAPDWALAGNAGGANTREIVRRISDKHGVDQRVGTFPHQVMSLDENFIIVRGGTRVAFSSDLKGFHFYGADICLVADILGHSSWVIDFHLKHLGAGKTGPDFATSEAAFRAKWDQAFRDRSMQTTCAFVTLSGRNRSFLRRKTEEAAQLKLARLRRSISKRKR